MLLGGVYKAGAAGGRGKCWELEVLGLLCGEEAVGKEPICADLDIYKSIAEASWGLAGG